MTHFKTLKAFRTFEGDSGGGSGVIVAMQHGLRLYLPP